MIPKSHPAPNQVAGFLLQKHPLRLGDVFKALVLYLETEFLSDYISK